MFTRVGNSALSNASETKLMQTEIGLKGKLYNLREARELFGLVHSVTEDQNDQLAPVQARLNKMLANDPRRKVYEKDYERIVEQWSNKIQLLGARVSGLWMVEFDVGEGSLAWRYPELSLNYFLPHGTSFSERVVLRDYIEENDPDWAR